MLRLYLPPLLISAIIAGGLTFYVKVFAERFKIFDYPAPRKIHPKPVPRFGGVAIVLALLIMVAGYQLASDRLSFGAEKIWFFDQKILGVILGLLVISFCGVLDDIGNLSPLKKLFWQIIAATIVVGFGVSIGFLRLPFGNHLDLGSPNFHFCLGGLCGNIPILADLVSIIWLVLIINTFNFLDGLDGLATGVAAIAAIAIFFLSRSLGQDANALFSVLIAGIALGFLPWNFNPARIFLGDSGSMALGYLVAVLAMISGGKLATSFLALGIPVLDVVWVIFRRLFRGRSPMLPDKRHFHHRLLAAGFSQRQAVLILYLTSILFGLIAVSAKTQQKIIATLVLVALMAVLAVILIVIELKRRSPKDA